MVAIAYFCPCCWSEIGNTPVCPFCRADLRQFEGESCEKKLIRALHHPEPTVPFRVATMLGMLGSQAAVEPLIEVAVSSADPYIQEAAAEALGQIGDHRASPCLNRLRKEGTVRVRLAADKALVALELSQNANQR